MSLLLFFSQSTPATLTDAEIGALISLANDWHRAAVVWRQMGYDNQAQNADWLSFGYREDAIDADPGRTAQAWADERVTHRLMETYFSDRYGWTFNAFPPISGTADLTTSEKLVRSMELHEQGMALRRIPDNTSATRVLTEAYDLRVAADAEDPGHLVPEWELSDHTALMAFYTAYLGL